MGAMRVRNSWRSTSGGVFALRGGENPWQTGEGRSQTGSNRWSVGDTRMGGRLRVVIIVLTCSVYGAVVGLRCWPAGCCVHWYIGEQVVGGSGCRTVRPVAAVDEGVMVL